MPTNAPNNLICPKCGREYPWQVPRRYCLTCKTEFSRGTCYVCREYKDYLAHGKCKECSKTIGKYSMQRRRAAASTDYDTWVAMVSTVPKPYKFLSEEEWLHTCNFFKGCAICGTHDISARVLFIPVHRGGSYTRFNVIPACEECATSYKQAIKNRGNPFTRLFNEYTVAAKNRLKRLVDYLQEEFDEYKKS